MNVPQLDEKNLNIAHSKIYEFPPNPTEFPKYYHCKEQIFVLHPGDMLYIPSRWFHWIFSYGDSQTDPSVNQNIAVSFNVRNYNNGKIYNEFYQRKPFIYTLDSIHHPFLNLDFKTINKPEYKDILHPVFISKNKTIIPVDKPKDKGILKQLTFDQMYDLYKNEKYNASIGQYMDMSNYLNINIPHHVKNSFPDDNINTNLWINLIHKKNSYIETGLHYDLTDNVLVQVRGTKVVSLSLSRLVTRHKFLHILCNYITDFTPQMMLIISIYNPLIYENDKQCKINQSIEN